MGCSILPPDVYLAKSLLTSPNQYGRCLFLEFLRIVTDSYCPGAGGNSITI